MQVTCIYSIHVCIYTSISLSKDIYIYTHIACSIGLLGLYVLISCPQDSKHHFLDVSRCVVWTMLCWMTCAIWIIVCTFTKVTKDVSPAHVICTGIVSLSPMSHLRVEGQAQQHLLHVSLSLGLQNSGVSCTKSTARKHHFDFILAKNTKDVWKKPQFWLTEKGWKVESIRYCVYIYFKKYAYIYIYMYNYIYNYIYIYYIAVYVCIKLGVPFFDQRSTMRWNGGRFVRASEDSWTTSEKLVWIERSWHFVRNEWYDEVESRWIFGYLRSLPVFGAERKPCMMTLGMTVVVW